MNAVFKYKAIKWLEDKAYPYSKNDPEAIVARDVLSIINCYKESNERLHNAISDIEQSLYDMDVDSIEVRNIIDNLPWDDD